MNRPVAAHGSLGAVIALKPANVAKSRLGVLPTPLRERLAMAMALDTLTALQAAGARLVVVTGDPTIPAILSRAGIWADVLPEPEPAGMNPALAAGAAALQTAGCHRVMACVGDLPALTGGAVQALMARIDDQQLDRAFVPDHSGVGSTMLVVTGRELDPRFQGRSAAAHRDSAAIEIRIDDFPQLHSDVDAPEDLVRVIDLGVGRHTAALIDPDARRLADYVPITVADAVGVDAGPAAVIDPVVYRVITDTGVRLELPADRLDPQPFLLRPGQRLHAAVVGSRLISAWW